MASQINGAVSGTVATKADIERVETRMELLKTQLTNRIWIALGTFAVLIKALDYLLPAIGG
ncbi:MAG: hypothetical protein OXC80_00210 [Gammaproteobacteria bacterium]|nr:hypothetical protein [Gammaproteobacteria bacterium]